MGLSANPYDAGCVARYENGSNQPMVLCGMGCIPAVSQRFLRFYTLPPL